MKLLDRAPPHSVVVNGEWKSLSVEDLRMSYDRRRRHMVGHEISKTHFANISSTMNTSVQKPVWVGCWYSEGGAANVTLGEHHLEGLRSAIHCGHFSAVKVIAWQNVDNLPRGATVVPGDSVLKRETVEEYLSGKYIVQWIADYCRLLQCYLESSVGLYSVLADFDTIWLPNAWPTDLGDLGHWFATDVENPVSRRNLNPKGREIYYALHYAKTPRDKRHLDFPAMFAPGSPMLVATIKAVRLYFKSGVALDPLLKNNYNHIMNIVAENVTDFGLESAYLEPRALNIIPYFKAAASVKPKTETLQLNLLCRSVVSRPVPSCVFVSVSFSSALFVFS